MSRLFVGSMSVSGRLSLLETPLPIVQIMASFLSRESLDYKINGEREETRAPCPSITL